MCKQPTTDYQVPNMEADKDGFYVPTVVKKSSIPNAGNARYFLESHKKGAIVRRQKIDSKIYFRNIEEVKDSGIDIEHLGHMGCSPPPECEFYQDAIFVNNPPMYSQQSPNPNIYCTYTETEKLCILLRDVEPEEEWQQDYAAYREVKWFEDYMNGMNLKSLRQFGAELNAMYASGELTN